MKKYRWLILGAGRAAADMARALQEENGEIYAVAARSPEKARAFAEKYHIEKVYGDMEEALQDKKTDIVYIATPHDSHYEWMKKAAGQGKHILCEKSITVNAWQLLEVYAMANRSGSIVAEAMTLYHMPLYRQLDAILKSGALGAVKLVQVNFGSCKPDDPEGRFFSKEYAGGALLDIGVYALAFARFFLAAQPGVILTTPCYFETGVDEQSGIIMKNGMGQLAVTALTMRAKQPKRGVVSCEKGYIEIEDYPRADKAVIVWTESGKREEICAGETDMALRYEIRDMQAAVLTGRTETLFCPYTADVMQLMDHVRTQWGLRYPCERERH